jgi:hypothetical protein
MTQRRSTGRTVQWISRPCFGGSSSTGFETAAVDTLSKALAGIAEINLTAVLRK